MIDPKNDARQRDIRRNSTRPSLRIFRGSSLTLATMPQSKMLPVLAVFASLLSGATAQSSTSATAQSSAAQSSAVAQSSASSATAPPPQSTVSQVAVSTAIATPSGAASSILPSQAALPPTQSWCPSQIFCAGPVRKPNALLSFLYDLTPSAASTNP